MTSSSARRKARRRATASVRRTPTRSAVVLGGLAWIVSPLQVQVAQVIAASAWNPPYYVLNNYISDLGNTACGQFAVPHGVPTYVCSPLHSVMNGSFLLTGVLTILGAILLQRIWPPGRLNTAALALWVVAGLGKIMVAAYPENTNVELHLLGALNIPVGCIAILLQSLSIVRTNRTLGLTGIALVVVGLAGTVWSTAGQFSSSLYLGLGVGGMERVSEYPGNLWMLLIGLLAVRSAGRLDRPVQKPN